VLQKVGSGECTGHIPRLIIPSPMTRSKVVSDRLWCGQLLNLVETTLTIVPVSRAAQNFFVTFLFFSIAYV